MISLLSISIIYSKSTIKRYGERILKEINKKRYDIIDKLYITLDYI